MKTKIIAAKMLSAVVLAATVFSAHADNKSDGVTFPELKETWLEIGDFTGPDHIRRIHLGMNKDQVASQIGNPHFSEGIGGTKIWNYAFNFYTGRGDEYITCQYQVHFDRKDTRVKGTYWKDKQCEDLVNEKPVNLPIINQQHPLVLNSDGLFAFGRSGLNDLQISGRENLSNLVGQLKTGYKTIRSIKIVGYTDRIGSVKSNNALSLARAETVKHYLVSQGISSALITTSGSGSSSPVVNCPGKSSPQVIACLMPNRRIEVTVNGDI